MAAVATSLGDNRLLVTISIGTCDYAFYVEADDKLITPWFVVSGKYETELIRYLRRTIRYERHCVDVGTNFGCFTVLMARLATRGRVVGIEAERRMADFVRPGLRPYRRTRRRAIALSFDTLAVLLYQAAVVRRR